MTKASKPCPDCGACVGEKHKDSCDVERCPAAADKLWGASGSIRTTRVAKYGTGAGRGRRTANASGSLSAATAPGYLRNADGTPSGNDGSTTRP